MSHPNNLKEDIKNFGHLGRFHKVYKWTGGLQEFTSSLGNQGPGYGVGAIIVSGSKTNFDQEAYVKLTGGGSILIKDLAPVDSADAHSSPMFELSISEISGCAAGNSTTPGTAPNKGVEFIQSGVVYVLHRNPRIS